MNEAGDWAVTWDVNDAGLGTNIEALIVNGEVLLKEGDAVDWDGNGTPDSVYLTDFTGISSVVVGARDVNGEFDVGFVADCNVGGQTLEGFFLLTVPEPASILLLGIGVVPLLRRRR
jgi:hypothetical protein